MKRLPSYGFLLFIMAVMGGRVPLYDLTSSGMTHSWNGPLKRAVVGACLMGHTRVPNTTAPALGGYVSQGRSAARAAAVLADALRHGIFQERQAEFVTDALPVSLIGMNGEAMSQYVAYCADRLLVGQVSREDHGRHLHLGPPWPAGAGRGHTPRRIPPALLVVPLLLLLHGASCRLGLALGAPCLTALPAVAASRAQASASAARVSEGEGC